MEDIKKLVKEKKVIIGTEQTVKGLKTGKVARVLLASNCPADVADDIRRYAELSGAKVDELDMPGDEFGIVCKKQFPVSVLGVMKE